MKPHEQAFVDSLRQRGEDEKPRWFPPDENPTVTLPPATRARVERMLSDHEYADRREARIAAMRARRAR